MPEPLIRDLVQVVPRPTVVRLQDLEGADAGWLSESYHRTAEVERHLLALQHVLQQSFGAGAFLIGAYGSGKSHFLAYLARLVGSGGWLNAPPPRVVPVSLLSFRAELALEDIVGGILGFPAGQPDRRVRWQEVAAENPQGVLLLFDEVSEFLRSKPTPAAFNEDVRFLQFLGEWARDYRLWVVAAAQEQVEHAGKLESALYRKLKDRYPLRLLLSPMHTRELIRDHLLRKETGYAAAVRLLAAQIEHALPTIRIDFAALADLYPLHPATLDLLEEVRDHFSQTRGVVDFVLSRLGGNPARGIEPFIDRQWGDLVTPDVVFDHFADLFEVQPEFCEIAQSVLAHYRRHLPEIFPTEAGQQLAWRLLKLLVLVTVSRQREGLSALDATAWLLFRATSIAPAKNLQVVERTLRTLASEGRYVRELGGCFQLDLRDDSAQRLEAMLVREVTSLEAGSEDAVFDLLTGALAVEGFNPFELPRELWQHRTVRWHFHERKLAVFLGNGDPPPCPGTALCIRLPWGQPSPAVGFTTLLPQPIGLSRELVELAALLRLASQPGGGELAAAIERRVRERRGLLAAQVRVAYGEASAVGVDGHRERPAQPQANVSFSLWLDRQAIWLLQRSFPSFERFAPAHGPLPREALRALGRVAAEGGGWECTGSDPLTLVSEGYLVPMGLLRRDGGGYRVVARLDQHDLVRLVGSLAEQQPPVSVVYQTLAGSVYGLVPDQIHVLLIFLLAQGQLDIEKARRSFREVYETFPTPAQYDRVVPGRCLAAEHLTALDELCTAFEVRRPKQWTLAAQRLAVRQLREAAGRLRGRLRGLSVRLEGVPEGEGLREAITRLVTPLAALDRTADELDAFEQLAFEAGSVRRLAAEIARLGDLPERLPSLLGEARRLRHLLAHPALGRVHEPDLRARLAEVGELPRLDDLAALEQALARWRAAYAAWCEHYRVAHGAFWEGVAGHAIWRWEVPPVARSRQVGLGEELGELAGCRERAVGARCGGLSSLEFQALCSCGYDGESAPILSELARWELAQERVESTLRRFFAQPRVAEQVRSWHSEGVEQPASVHEYLAGRRPVPEVADVEAFDRHLAGVEVVEEVDGSELLASVEGRAWEATELAKELERLLIGRGGRRFRISSRREHGTPPAVLRWCVEQSLRNAQSLPDGLPTIPREIASAVLPEWVARESLARIEHLGLGEAVEDRVLAMVLDGQLKLPGTTAADSLAGALAGLVDSRRVASPEQLASEAARAYTWHPRLHGVAGQRWLDRLDALARESLPFEIPELIEALRAFGTHQWVIVDCLGLPLLSRARDVLTAALPAWVQGMTVFARVRPPTTTESCLAALAAEGVNRPLHKLGGVDRLLHERTCAFSDIQRLVAAELDVALRQLGKRLDASQPLLLFADHGFRLAADGRGYVHGGFSTLECVVPLIEMQPA